MAVAMMAVACRPEVVETLNERDIFYTVNEVPGMPGMSGTSVHLNTDSEFDALLDRFCDYTVGGKQVVFCSSSRVETKEGAGTTPTTITTADREQLKAWMKKMEQAGKTVVVTYDDGSGTWNGTAYANIAPDNSETREYTGVLVSVPVPMIEAEPIEGTVLALRVATDSALILTIHGMMFWDGGEAQGGYIPDEFMVTLGGTVGTHVDLAGEEFHVLELNESYFEEFK